MLIEKTIHNKMALNAMLYSYEMYRFFCLFLFVLSLFSWWNLRHYVNRISFAVAEWKIEKLFIARLFAWLFDCFFQRARVYTQRFSLVVVRFPLEFICTGATLKVTRTMCLMYANWKGEFSMNTRGTYSILMIPKGSIVYLVFSPLFSFSLTHSPSLRSSQ